MENDIKMLLKIDNRLQAEEIKAFLEENNIFVLLESDNAASSVMHAYAGPNVLEIITIMVNKDDYQSAVKIIKNTHYADLINADI